VEGVPTDLLTEALTSPWSLVLMSVLVVGDAFFVVVPGEVAVTALGALSVTSGCIRRRSAPWSQRSSPAALSSPCLSRSSSPSGSAC
jgi:hypothetical protein